MTHDRFGAFVRQVRETQGISAAELAERLSVTPEQVDEWECGRAMPDEEMLCHLADALGVNVPELEQGMYLYTDEPSATPSEILPAISGKTKWLRVGAYLLDGLITCQVMMIWMMVTAPAYVKTQSVVWKTALYIGAYLIVSLYGLRDWIGNGRSLGKWLVGLTVCDKKTAKKPRWWQLVFHHILNGNWIDLILVWIIGRTIGDCLFGTFVLAEHEALLWQERLKRSANGDEHNDGNYGD